MPILMICLVIFIVFMAAGYAGLFVQGRLLTEAHRTAESKGVVGQVSGLVSLLLALVLGTLIGVSFAYYSTQKSNLETFSAQILRLDRALKQYGPETQPLRDKLRAGIVKELSDILGRQGCRSEGAYGRDAFAVAADAISDFLATLQPKTDAQKAALATANQYASMVMQFAALDSPPGGERGRFPGSLSQFPSLLDGERYFSASVFTPRRMGWSIRTRWRSGSVDCLRDLHDLRIRLAVYRPLSGSSRRA